MAGNVIVNVPFRGLSTSNIRRRFLCFLRQPSSTVRVLFTNGLSIREVLCSVDDEDERSNLGAIDAHIREDTGCMHAVQWVGWLRFGCHVDLSYLPALIERIGVKIGIFVSKELASKKN